MKELTAIEEIALKGLKSSTNQDDALALVEVHPEVARQFAKHLLENPEKEYSSKCEGQSAHSFYAARLLSALGESPESIAQDLVMAIWEEAPFSWSEKEPHEKPGHDMVRLLSNFASYISGAVNRLKGELPEVEWAFWHALTEVITPDSLEVMTRHEKTREYAFETSKIKKWIDSGTLDETLANDSDIIIDHNGEERDDYKNKAKGLESILVHSIYSRSSIQSIYFDDPDIFLSQLETGLGQPHFDEMGFSRAKYNYVTARDTILKDHAYCIAEVTKRIDNIDHYTQPKDAPKPTLFEKLRRK